MDILKRTHAIGEKRQVCCLWIVFASCAGYFSNSQGLAMPVSLHPASATGVIVFDGQTYRLEFWHVGQVEGYRLSRSSLKVKVIGQKSRSPGKKTFFSVGCHHSNAEETRK